MQNEVTFIIDESGNAVYLLTEAAMALRFEEKPLHLRASHVEPVNPALRILFHLFRQWLGDKGRMSDFTRSWNCCWRVNLKPVGGGVLPKVWRDRKAAIDAEVEALNKFFIGE